MAKVAINGLGRIGRTAFKIILDTSELELVAVNDLVPADNLAYLLKKVMSWYDNEWGYTNQMIREAVDIAKKIGK
jgi:glyceraldehyde 3-phosphate dehydrogenase